MKRTKFSDFLTGKILLYLRIIANFSNRKSLKDYPANISSTSLVDGFTMLELMIVVFMIGILSAIAAPSWDAFTTKQRVKAVNNQVLRALMTAQSEAKSRKNPITVKFNTTTAPSTLEIQLGQPSTQPSPPSSPVVLKTISLNGEGEIQPDMIKISVYAGTANPPVAYTPKTLTFDYNGAVIIDDANAPLNVEPNNTFPFFITIASKAGGTKECVRVETLLGAMITGSDNYDATNNPTGCP